MKFRDIAEGDFVIVDGVFHYFIDKYKYEMLDKHFPDREDLRKELTAAGYREGLQCNEDQLDVVALNGDYAVFRFCKYLGAYLTDRFLFDEYLTIVDILPGDPPVSQESVPSLSESVLDLLESGS